MLLAPASIIFAPIELAPIEPMYLLRAIYYALAMIYSSQDWFCRCMSADPKFTTLEAEFDALNLRHLCVIRGVAATVLAVRPPSLDDDVLREVTEKNPSLLVTLGKKEK